MDAFLCVIQLFSHFLKSSERLANSLGARGLLAYVNISNYEKVQKTDVNSIPLQAALVFITSLPLLLPHSAVMRCLTPLGLALFSISAKPAEQMF